MNNQGKSLLQNLKVLYVEDEELTRQELSKIIKRRAGKLFIAKNGEEGIESFKENKPDIVVTDLRMPNIDGLEMVREIRKMDENCQIIIISALSDSENILNAVDIGIVKYLVKPVNTSQLIETMEKLASNILKHTLNETVVHDTIYLDKDKKQELEDQIRKELALFIKTYSGKGPKIINVFIKGNEIEVKANETLTVFETALISNDKNNSLVEYNRKLFYSDRKNLLEEIVGNTLDAKVKLKEVSVDSKVNTDTLIFSLF